MKACLSFAEITEQDKILVGGKAFVLSQLIKQNCNVPAGFVLSSVATKNWGKKNIPAEILQEIFEQFLSLRTELVAVRSSGINEDGVTASWAGQFTTKLNVNKDSLISSIDECIHSTTSKNLAVYSDKMSSSINSGMAVIIQKMVPSQFSGVIFTTNPITKNSDEVYIEVVAGLGEQLAQGEVTPNSYILNKKQLRIVSVTVGDQGVELPESLLQELTLEAKKIETIFQFPQDIEWAWTIEGLYILQSRPITTLRI